MELAQPVLRGWSYVDARVTALIRRRGTRRPDLRERVGVPNGTADFVLGGAGRGLESTRFRRYALPRHARGPSTHFPSFSSFMSSSSE
jgi:hypothetical protein